MRLFDQGHLMTDKTKKVEINGITVRVLEAHKTNKTYKTDKQQVFIIGSKGIPASYGGFETFVEKLTEYQSSEKIRYHVARLSNDTVRYEYNGAKCFSIKVPNIGAARAVYYDLAALKYCIDYCKARPDIRRPVFYVLACRIGPFIGYFKKKIKNLGGVLYLNPDGHEWLRGKWSMPVRKYWKISERLMTKHADLLICDSKNIEKYIQSEYQKYHPETMYIAYGSDMGKSMLNDSADIYVQWMKDQGLSPKDYYLVVGRFVPENNFETMIREFMKSSTKKSFAIITTANDAFLEELEKKLHFKSDRRIKFVGTVYDQELLKKIRENAYAYLHGHEVGGTNPSLLEALGSTDLNLLLDVGFNREVGEDAALYWTKEEGNLTDLIERTDQMEESVRKEMGIKAKNRIKKAYSWRFIVQEYENVFIGEKKD